jgi:predicted dehydrogenase
MRQSRRAFLSSGALAAGYFLVSPSRSVADEAKSPNARPRIGCIGVGGRGTAISKDAKKYADVVAVCDVDLTHATKFNHDLCEGKAEVLQDYRKLLDRKDVDAVIVGTPDHWHTRISVDAMRAGKDVYCEKPLTLTIDEGKQLCRAVTDTKRVLQVGTQQRSEFAHRFLKAVAMVHDGRIGKVRQVTCCINAGVAGGPFAAANVPAGLDWERWLGQAAKVDYIAERCHHTFRWWFEYSGGKLTDWGAHHVDIAQWAIGMDQSGPLSIETVRAELPNPQIQGRPACADCYNTATTFDVRCRFPNDVEMLITSTGENGITFDGESGKFFVSRAKLHGGPVDELKSRPLSSDAQMKLRKGKRASSHMANFFECCRDRSLPASDVYSHHRSLTTCHLANISIRLDRKLTWDAAKEEIVGDTEANGHLRREQRKGYETNV